jgi:hypothetical protein
MMSKKILVFADTNIVAQVAEEEFEVHPSLVWKTVTDDAVEQGWQYNPDDNSVQDVVAAAEAEYYSTPTGKRRKMMEDRALAYGKIEDQLDAIYRDLRDGTSKYVEHITAVKTKHAKVDPVESWDKDSVTGE